VNRTRGVHTTEIKLCDDWGDMAMWGRKSGAWGDLICFDLNFDLTWLDLTWLWRGRREICGLRNEEWGIGCEAGVGKAVKVCCVCGRRGWYVMAGKEFRV
jgi:hypothetical protein